MLTDIEAESLALELSAVTKVDPSALQKDIIGLNSLFEDIKVKNGNIELYTYDIVLKGDIPIGQIIVLFNWKKYLKAIPTIWTSSLRDILHPKAGRGTTTFEHSCFHPNVYDNHFCLGETSENFLKALNKGLIFEFFAMLLAMLNGSIKGRLPIERWGEVTPGGLCSNCMSGVRLRNVRCGVCDTYSVCTKCSAKCCSCKYIFHVACLQKTVVDGQTLLGCSSCFMKCSKCKVSYPINIMEYGTYGYTCKKCILS